MSVCLREGTNNGCLERCRKRTVGKDALTMLVIVSLYFEHSQPLGIISGLNVSDSQKQAMGTVRDGRCWNGVEFK